MRVERPVGGFAVRSLPEEADVGNQREADDQAERGKHQSRNETVVRGLGCLSQCGRCDQEKRCGRQQYFLRHGQPSNFNIETGQRSSGMQVPKLLQGLGTTTLVLGP